MVDSLNSIALDKSDRTLAILLLTSLLLTYSLFSQPPYISENKIVPAAVYNFNIVSRIAVALSIVQDGTLSIDRFQEFTGDKAYFNGKFYSDKAPGMALLSVPLVYGIDRALSIISQNKPVIIKGKIAHLWLYVYASTILTSGLFTAAAAAALFLTARGLGATPVGAVFGALSYGIATPAFGWATAFVGHATAGASLLLAFAAVVALQRGGPNPRHPLLLGWSVGSLLGLAMVVEFTTVPAAAVIALCALRVAVGLDVQRWRVLCCAFISGAVMLTLLGLYNYFAFGSPTHIGYESQVGFPEMKQGLVGIGVPKPEVLARILFGRYRGLFMFSPILFLASWSTLDTWRKGLLSNEHFACIVAVVTSFLLINSGFVNWDAGWSTGPRYITPMIALLCLPLGLQWSSVGRVFRGILITLFIVSVAISLAAASVSMGAPQDYKSPLTQFIIPNFLRGDLFASVFSPTWSVMIPLIMIWVLSAVTGKRLLRRARRAN
jgi:hypothetical protein